MSGIEDLFFSIFFRFCLSKEFFDKVQDGKITIKKIKYSRSNFMKGLKLAANVYQLCEGWNCCLSSPELMPNK